MGKTFRVDMTRGGITSGMLLFAVPMFVGNMMQQLYNIADMVIVGRLVGTGALAAVGTSYALMVFITSVVFGLSLGSGTLISVHFGAGDWSMLRKSVFVSFVSIGLVSLLLTFASVALIDPVMAALRVPDEIYADMRVYLLTVFCGIPFLFLYNYVSSVMRAVGDSVGPLFFLAVTVLLNIVLDLVFIIPFGMGIGGAALATLLSQAVSGIGVLLYMLRKGRELVPGKDEMVFDRDVAKEIFSYSFLTCAQQSVMNFGILLVQGLVNSFGTVVMAAFAAAVKVDSFAYMPVQDFGNAFSTFVAQNRGASRDDRVARGIRSAFSVAMVFSLSVSVMVFLLAEPLMRLFVDASETAVIAEGARYLRIEGAFYCGIGLLFLLYGFFRAAGSPAISLVLTVISLGSRVVLAHLFSGFAGVSGIWWSIPVGWALADIAGFMLLFRNKVFVSGRRKF